MKYLRSMPLLFLVILIVSIMLAALRICKATNARQKLQTLAYRITLKIWRIKITQIGELAPPPVMIIANHCSYVDVPILGALGSMRFTPKSEVRGWFLIGRVVRAFDVVFVDRTPSRANNTQSQLQQALQQSKRLCIFPEGTTNNGTMLKPFKSSMFSLVAGTETLLQPIAIKYKSVNGAPLDAKTWECIAWFGDASLLPHMWRLGRFKNIKVEVHCLPPLNPQGANRKELAQQAEQLIKAIVMN